MSSPPAYPNQPPNPYWGPGSVPPPPQRPTPPWYRKGWVIAVAALLLGIGIGSAGSDDNTTPSAAATDLTDAPSTVMVTTTKPAPAPRIVKITRTKPAPAPTTVTVTRRAAIARAPSPTQQAAPASNCASGYTPCLPVVSDLNCDDIAFTVRVTGSDQYGLDADGDGYGCDS